MFKKIILAMLSITVYTSCSSSEKNMTNRVPQQVGEVDRMMTASSNTEAYAPSNLQSELVYSEKKIISPKDISNIILDRAEPATTQYVVIQSKGTISGCSFRGSLGTKDGSNIVTAYKASALQAPLSMIVKIGDASKLKGYLLITDSLCDDRKTYLCATGNCMGPGISNEVITYKYNGKGELLSTHQQGKSYRDTQMYIHSSIFGF